MIREAIRLGNTADGGLGSDKIFPYIYNFVSDEDGPGFFVPLTGTASVVLGDVLRQIVGVGTLFLTDLAIGDCVQVGTEYFVIQSITNDLLAIATTVPTTNQVAQPVSRQRISDTIGPVVPFGGSSDLSIRLRPDYNFVPRWLRLTCYFNNAGSYEWWDRPPNLLKGTATVVLGDVLQQINGVGTEFTVDFSVGMQVLVGTEQFTIQSITNDTLAIATAIPTTNQVAQPIQNLNASILLQNKLSSMGQPISAFILVRMNVYPDARYMIGGAIMNATNTNSVISIPLINGEDSGIRGIPQPYLLPATGNIQLNFTNIHASKNILVGGCIYGWKVRL